MTRHQRQPPSSVEEALLGDAAADPSSRRLQLVVADYYEDAGDAMLAHGWRWLALNGRWPHQCQRRGTWNWKARGRKEPHARPWHLPPQVTPGLAGKRFKSPEAAIKALAEALDRCRRAAELPPQAEWGERLGEGAHDGA